MEKGWVEFLSGNNCLIIRNSMDFEKLRNWIDDRKMRYIGYKSWEQAEKNQHYGQDKYILFASDGIEVFNTHLTYNEVLSSYKKKPLECNIIDQYYLEAAKDKTKDELLIAYNHYSNKEFENRIDTLPDSGILDVLYTVDDNENEVYCNYDVNKECYIYSCYQEDCVLTAKEFVPINVVVDDFKNCDFGDFYSATIANIENKSEVVKTPLSSETFEKEML